MFNVSSFLEKFKNLGGESILLKEIFIEAVKDATGIALEKKNVEIKNGTAFLKISPVIRTEIFIKKPAIFEKLAKNELSRKISDIR
jgi:hypothetical protein